MKKILFLILLSIGVVKFVNAQVIEVIGNGVLNETNLTLTIPNMGTVDHVVVEATAEFTDDYGVLPYQIPISVTFSSGATFKDAEFNNIDINKSQFVAYGQYWNFWNYKVASLGYYTATFNKADISGGVISLDKKGQGKNILTFYAYIHRTDGTVNKYSYISEKRAFLWLNGIGDPMEYEFDLPVVQAERNIKVTIPFSDNFETGTDYRIAVLYVVKGVQVLPSETFNLNAWGTNFLAKTVELGNVPGDVTKIIVAIYSPKTVYSEPGVIDLTKTGDSFLLGLPVLTVENIIDPGCTLTQGYWKTHSEYGPASKPDETWLVVGPDADFYLSNQTWIEVFNTSVSGNSYYQLAHQYMAAYLNTLHGAMVPSEVQDALDNASGIFETKTPDYFAKVKGKTLATKEEVTQMVTLASILGSYNEGLIGPGHCGDMEEKSARISDEIGIAQISEFAVYPNPVSNNAIVSFNPINDGLATVELYNSVGQKVGRLLQQNVLKGIQAKANFSGLELKEGLYFMVLQNGNYTETVKVSIAR